MIVFSDILKEVSYKTARSGGAGGQHVNKVETKVTLTWNIPDSKAIHVSQKEQLLLRLAKRIDQDGNLSLSCQEKRSQLQNKRIAEKKLEELITQGLRRVKKRIPTKISRAKKEKRLKVKRVKSEHKQNRKKVKW